MAAHGNVAVLSSCIVPAAATEWISTCVAGWDFLRRRCCTTVDCDVVSAALQARGPVLN